MMMKKIPFQGYLIKYAESLKENMTFSEVRFWKQVRNREMMGYTFERQKPILNFIVDFYCSELALVIEIDGLTHEDERTQLKDDHKENELKKIGLEVLRFSAREVIKDMPNVIRALENYILDLEERRGVLQRIRSWRAGPRSFLRKKQEALNRKFF